MLDKYSARQVAPPDYRRLLAAGEREPGARPEGDRVVRDRPTPIEARVIPKDREAAVVLLNHDGPRDCDGHPVEIHRAGIHEEVLLPVAAEVDRRLREPAEAHARDLARPGLVPRQAHRGVGAELVGTARVRRGRRGRRGREGAVRRARRLGAGRPQHHRVSRPQAQTLDVVNAAEHPCRAVVGLV